MKSQDVFKIPRKMLWCVGQDPLENSAAAKIWSGFITTTQVVFGTLCAFKIYLNVQQDISVIVSALEAFGSFYQMVFKNCFFAWKKNRLAALLATLQNDFTKKYQHDEEIESDTKLVFTVSQNWRELFYDCWLPTFDTPFYQIAYFLQIFALFGAVHIVTGCDCMFGAICANVIVQFKILNQQMTKIDYGSRPSKLNECIKQHQFLLSLCKNMQDIFSFLILNQIGMTIILVCMEMYILLETSYNINTLFYAVTYLILLLLELGIYCVGISEINAESAKTSYAIYNSNWYETLLKSKASSLSYIMVHSQQPLNFNAGGIYPINMKNYMSVLKAGFSFYTYMTHVRR